MSGSRPKPWINTIRRESGLIENICKCGVGHPAIASVDWIASLGPDRETARLALGTHGCCGCCQHPDWQREDMLTGIEKANDIINNYRRREKAGIACYEALKDTIAELREENKKLCQSLKGARGQRSSCKSPKRTPSKARARARRSAA